MRFQFLDLNDLLKDPKINVFTIAFKYINGKFNKEFIGR